MMMISHNMSLTIARAKILFTPQIHKLGDAYGRHYAVNKNRHNRFGSTHDYLELQQKRTSLSSEGSFLTENSGHLTLDRFKSFTHCLA